MKMKKMRIAKQRRGRAKWKRMKVTVMNRRKKIQQKKEKEEKEQLFNQWLRKIHMGQKNSKLKGK